MLSQIFPIYDILSGNKLRIFESCMNIFKALSEKKKYVNGTSRGWTINNFQKCPTWAI